MSESQDAAPPDRPEQVMSETIWNSFGSIDAISLVAIVYVAMRIAALPFRLFRRLVARDS